MPLEPDFYHLFRCLACNTRQRVYLGDPADVTLPDVEAVRCYQCGVVERFPEDELEEHVEDDDLFIRDGEPFQKE